MPNPTVSAPLPKLTVAFVSFNIRELTLKAVQALHDTTSTPAARAEPWPQICRQGN